MSQLRGDQFMIYEGGTPIAITGEKSARVTANHAPADASSKASAWAVKLGGKLSWNASSDGVYEVADAGITALLAALTARTAVDVKVRDTANHKQDSGSAYVTNVEKSGSDGDVVMYSVTLEGTGALTFESTY